MIKKKTVISKEEVRHVADLAKLPLTPQEINKFQKQLAKILNYISLLNQVDSSEVGPTSQATGRKNISAKDGMPEKSFPAGAAISNSPRRHQNYFKVEGIFTE